MSDEDKKGFVVRDRRRFDASGNRRDDEEPAAETREGRDRPLGGPRPGGGGSRPAAPQPQPQPEQPRRRPIEPAPEEDEGMPEMEGGEEAGPVSFAEFILSIATNAIIHLG